MMIAFLFPGRWLNIFAELERKEKKTRWKYIWNKNKNLMLLLLFRSEILGALTNMRIM